MARPISGSKAWFSRLFSRRKFIFSGWMAAAIGSQALDGVWQFLVEYGTPILLAVLSAIAKSISEQLDPRPDWKPTDDEWPEYHPPSDEDGWRPRPRVKPQWWQVWRGGDQ